MTMGDAAETDDLEEDLRPNLVFLLSGTVAVALISALSLPWPVALASTLLGALMLAGADVDARVFLLPDLVTLGGTVSGIAAAYALAPVDAVWSAVDAGIQAAATAAVVALVRWSYERWRGCEGLGFGDVKLAAAVGAWLPLQAISLCFALATGAALVAVIVARLRGQTIGTTMKLPFGAFLCPALWLIFYVTALPGQ
ncbi:MAG TPA: A24 family peptidase [Pseudolabrys sp.]|jgi:leader peptidase (prepilin peptidase)/N-methyltransferase|nr:A24 family peptidase [Pseudolabrys sp.]